MFVPRRDRFAIALFGWLILGMPGIGPVDFAAALDPRKALTQYVHESWSTEDGLAQNSVNDIVQTGDGYLWLATFGGLARFNGVEFKVYDSGATTGLKSNRITALEEAPDGALWFGAEDGYLGFLRDGVFVTLPRDLQTPIDTIWDLHFDDDGSETGSGTLWIADKLGLLRRSGGVLHRFAEVPPTNTFFRQGDRLWIGALATLIEWTGEEFRFHDLPEGSHMVHTIIDDGQGGLWIGETNGLFHFNGRTFKPWFRREGYRRGVPGSMVADRDGNLWISINRMVYRLRREDLADPQAAEAGAEGFAVDDGFVDSLIRTLLEDLEGNLWIGAAGGGLHRLRGGEFTSYRPLEGFPKARAQFITEARGQMLIGTACEGLFRFDGTGFLPLPGPDGPFTCIDSLLAEGNDLWVGAGGLFHLNARGTWKRIAGLPGEEVSGEGVNDEEVNDEEVTAIFRDARGVLWVGTSAGLARFDGAGPHIYTQADGLANSQVTFLTEDRHGTLWIGTRNGLSRFAPPYAAFDNLTVEDGLPDRHVRAIYEDAGGTVWIGTYGGGLMRLTAASLAAGTTRGTIFSTANGLPENIVSSILEDDGNFWLSGNRGVTRVRHAALDAFASGEIESYDTVLYGRSNGLEPSETNGGSQPAAWRSADGRLWFPTLRGIAVIDLRDLRPSPSPPVVIEEVRVDGKIVATRAPDIARPVRIAPGADRLEITYAGLHLAAPREVRYRYRLIGQGDAWIGADHRRTAYFNRLSPGTYRFEVSARAHDAAEPGAPARMTLIIEPFWWQTNGFRALVIALALLLIAAAVRRRMRRVRQRTERLEKANRALEDEILRRRRTEQDRALMLVELEQKVAELGQFNYTVSHDLKNPLLTIRTFVGKLEYDLPERSERVEQDLVRIREAAAEMSELLDDLVELARIGRAHTIKQKIDLTTLVHESVRELGDRLEGIDVLIDDLPTIIGDRARLREVFDHLLTNAARFMGDQKQPRIRVHCRQEGAKTILSVRDNGIGIEPVYHEKIFELFERLDTSREGTGIGLTIVRKIIELHGGRIWVESAGIGSGAAFCFVLPGGEG